MAPTAVPLLSHAQVTTPVYGIEAQKSQVIVETKALDETSDDAASDVQADTGIAPAMVDTTTSAVLHRSLHDNPLRVKSAKGIYLHLSNGQSIIDATAGAAVACVGHDHPKIKAAIAAQIDTVSYCHSLFFSTDAMEELCHELVAGTNGHMTRAFIVSSGSEAVEAAMKMSRQYFVELEGLGTKRKRFIARKQSYHGTTMGALGLGGHVLRRKIYEPMMSADVSHVSPCYAYRGMKDGETEEAFVDRLVDELDQEFQRVGPDSVCAFVAEPMVGAALGCVPCLPGYFKKVRKVCDKYGALLVLDEIMSGIGRSGYLHMWQSPLVDITPDLQTIGKGLGAGYAPVAAMLLSSRVENVLFKGTGSFMHGQTYQGHPVACATALAVQRVLREEKLVERSRKSGKLLGSLLQERLSDHLYVGNIRGMGLFWGMEIVKDKVTKESFDPSLRVGMRIHELGMKEPHSITIYPATGNEDGVKGDVVFVSPPYTCTEEEIRLIVDRTVATITAFFEKEFSF